MRITPFTLQQNIATDNAFSTIQVIHQLKSKVNDVIDIVNNIELDYENYTDHKIAELKEELETEIGLLDTQVQGLSDLTSQTVQLVNEISSTVRALQSIVAQNYAALDSKIDATKLDLLQRINDMSDSIMNYLDTEIVKLYAEVNRLIKERTAYTYSQWDGSWKPITDALNDIMTSSANQKSRPFTLNLWNRLLAQVYPTSAVTPEQWGLFTIDEFTTVVNAMNQTGSNYFYGQRTSGSGTQVYGNVAPTCFDFKVNNSVSLMYVLYQMTKRRDDATTWYGYHTLLSQAMGWDLYAWVNTFVYTQF